MMNRLLRLIGVRQDQELFLTHTPDAFKIGDRHHDDVITRIEPTSPTLLANGGRAGCWIVYGHKASAS